MKKTIIIAVVCLAIGGVAGFFVHHLQLQAAKEASAKAAEVEKIHRQNDMAKLEQLSKNLQTQMEEQKRLLEAQAAFDAQKSKAKEATQARVLTLITNLVSACLLDHTNGLAVSVTHKMIEEIEDSALAPQYLSPRQKRTLTSIETKIAELKQYEQKAAVKMETAMIAMKSSTSAQTQAMKFQLWNEANGLMKEAGRDAGERVRLRREIALLAKELAPAANDVLQSK